MAKGGHFAATQKGGEKWKIHSRNTAENRGRYAKHTEWLADGATRRKKNKLKCILNTGVLAKGNAKALIAEGTVEGRRY